MNLIDDIWILQDFDVDFQSYLSNLRSADKSNMKYQITAKREEKGTEDTRSNWKSLVSAAKKIMDIYFENDDFQNAIVVIR